VSALPDWIGLFVSCAGLIVTLSSFRAGTLWSRLRNRLGLVIFMGGFVLGAWLDQQEARRELFEALALAEAAREPIPGLLQEKVATDVRDLAAPWLAYWCVLFGVALGLLAAELARVKPWGTGRKAVTA
jgi:hypothetical protein